MTKKSKLIALLSYFSVLLFLPLWRFRSDDFAYYHAKQGVGLAMLFIVVVFAFWIPIVSWVCLLAYLVIWFTGVINVLSGKIEPLPLIGRIAERISFK